MADSDVESERETACLLKSRVMRQRLAEAKSREEGVSIEDACARLGI